MEPSLWAKRIANASKYYREWEVQYKCNQLEDYYRNKQWKLKMETLVPNYNPYTLNLVYSTIKIKLANIIFQNPQFLISPVPGNSNWDQEAASQSANLKQDVLNTIINNPRSHFARETKLSALDSFFRFAVMEIGYAADWRNPLKTQPYLKSHDDPEITEEKDRVIDENELPESERIYVKRIKARRFRVSASDSEFLDQCDWCGYYEWIYKSFLVKNKEIDFPDHYEGQYYSSDYNIIDSVDRKNTKLFELMATGAVCKVWHIWDNVSRTRYLLLDDGVHELWSDNFERLPISEIRWDMDLEGFYPIPPVFQWLSPQDEINETREQMRSYRKRFTRKYQAVKGTVDEEEKEKFASGPDGIIIQVNSPDAISGIQNPENGTSLENALIIGKDDFNIISGTSSEARGQADRTTATQAKLMDVRSQIRESAEQMDFSNFISSIGREVLLQAQERLTNDLWIKYTSDPGEDFMGEIKSLAPIYKQISAQQIDDGYDFLVKVDVTNQSPASQQEYLGKFIQFMSMLNQFPQLALSPILIREAAYLCGYRNEKVIQQMQQAALVHIMGQAQQVQQNQNGNAGNNLSKASVAQSSPNTIEQIQQQMQPQMQLPQ